MIGWMHMGNRHLSVRQGRTLQSNRYRESALGHNEVLLFIHRLQEEYGSES